MSEATLNPWLSAGKPVGAVAAKLLEAESLLDLDVPVAEYWPLFGSYGKDEITTRHILTHTAGLRTADAARTEPDHGTALEIITNASVEDGWVPGKRAAYHPFGTWQALGELVHLLSGSSYDQYVQENVFEPLAMRSSTFTPLANSDSTAPESVSPMYVTGGSRSAEGTRYPVPFATSFPRPPDGLMSTASDMVRLYRMLLGEGELNGAVVLDSDSARDIGSRHRVGMLDETFGQVMDWGLGVLLDNKRYGPAAPYGYGRHASDLTFGHGGRESSTAFVDPANELIVACVFNGMPGEPRHDRRLRAATTAIYEDLGLG